MQIAWIHAIIVSNKGKETDTAEERREDDLARPAAEQGTETETPHTPQTEHRSQGRKPEGQGTGKTAGARQTGRPHRTPRPNRTTKTQPDNQTGTLKAENTPPTLSLFSLSQSD